VEQLKKRGGASGGDATIRALVVEDNRDMALMMKSLLERRFGASVELAATCSDAREELRLDGFDIVTLDYQLPDGSGLDMLDEITAREGHPPVVMITGRGDEELAYLSLRMGASGYAAKDSKLSVMLVEAVEWALADDSLKRVEDSLRKKEHLVFLTSKTMARDLNEILEELRSACDDLKTSMRGLAEGPVRDAAGRVADRILNAAEKASALAAELRALTAEASGAGSEGNSRCG
jgi:DNA-binding NtrC family response regulator